MSVCEYVQIYVNAFMHAYAYLSIDICMYVCMYVCVYVYLGSIFSFKHVLIKYDRHFIPTYCIFDPFKSLCELFDF